MTGTASPSVVIGTSGWDYPEWVGPVYPSRGVDDRLAYYASRLFSAVEVNSTFYRLPPVSVARSWVRRTPPGFRFAAKFPRTITHDLKLRDADAELRRFLDVLAPLREADRFVAALLQLPPSLAFDAETARAFYASLPRDLPVAVEFREPSWLSEASFALLREHGLAFVVVDEPKLPARLAVTAPFAYVRFHGHGRPLWYDYTYTDQELAPWVERVRTLATEAPRGVYVFFNNHFRGDAVRNGRSFARQLGVPTARAPTLD